MTNEELIASLEEPMDTSIRKFEDWYNDERSKAADRIEALVKERERHLSTLEHMGAAVEQMQKAEARVERLEAAMRELVTCVEDGCFCSEMKMATAIDEARATLKGADHE